MWAARAASVLAVVAALAGCGGTEIPTPAPTSVTPARGFAGKVTPVVINGSGFSVLTVQPSGGGAPTVDETFQAWLGDDALLDVRRVDEQTLSAKVPAGLAAGRRTLRVQGPFGTSGELPDAFTVEGSALASLTAAIAAAPSRVSVGQSITVTLTVTNAATAAATGVIPSAPVVTGTATLGVPSGPQPASIPTLAPGASGTFNWTYRTTGDGTLAFAGGASATDSFSGTTVTCVTDPGRPATATVDRPAVLTASLPASGAAALGQEFTVAMTVSNTGGAAATSVVPGTPAVVPAALATLKAGTGPVPASVPSLAAGASASFTWTFVAGTTSGSLQISAGATGADANSGAIVTAATATSGPFIIGAAGIAVTAFTAAPATVSVGQALTLTLTLQNPGLADVRDFTLGTPSVNSTDRASAAPSSGPVPAPPSVLAAGQTFTTTWTFQPSLEQGVSVGHLTFGVTAAGTDAISGGAVSAQPTASATVQAPAGLAATLTPTRAPPVPTGQPFTVNVGQVFTLTLAVSNTGATAANAVAATPITGCAAPSPASATVSPGTPVAFLYANCSSATAGTLALSASASGTDANNPSLAVTTNTATASVIVQPPPAVAGALSIPSGIARGFPFNVTLTLTNSGGAPAVVTPGALAVVAGSTGAATLASGPTPGSVTVPGGGSASVQWTYNASSVGAISFTGNATGIDSNTGAAVPVIAVAASNVGMIGQGGLAISLGVLPTTATIGQQVLFTMTVTNTGTAAVNGIVPSLTLSGATGTLGAPVPATIASLATTAPGNTGTFTWTFTSTTSGPVTATASATGTDALSLAQVTASTVVSNILQVQTRALLSVTAFTAAPATVSIGQAVTVSMTVANTGGGSASLVAVALTPTGPAGTTCGVSGTPPTTIAGGGTGSFTWTCTPTVAGTLGFTATVNGRDASSNTVLVPTVNATATNTVVVVTRALLSVTAFTAAPATVSIGQAVTVSMTVANTGGGSASLVAVALTPTGPAGTTCGVSGTPPTTIAGGGTGSFTWTCTPTVAGTLGFTATVNGRDASSNTVLVPTVNATATNTVDVTP